MKDIDKIIRSSRYIIVLGCSCFCIYLGFLLVSYRAATDRLDKQFQNSTFPKLTKLIDQEIELFFKPSFKGLSLLSETLDWQEIMRKASVDPAWLKSQMKAWAAELEVNSVSVSDGDRRVVWDYWSNDPVKLDPSSLRDAWFFDFWRREKKPDWTFNLYSESKAEDYQLYIDRLIRDRNGRPMGSISAMISLARLREQLLKTISKGERIIILGDKENVIIDISHMEIGEGVKTYDFEGSAVKENSTGSGDVLVKEILSQSSAYGHLRADNENIFYKRTAIFNGALSVLTVMNTSFELQKERDQLIKDIILLFASFTLFIGGILATMMFFSQRMKVLAINFEMAKSTIEDLLFIITHGIANELLLLQKNINGIPRRFFAGMDFRMNEMNLLIQNSINAVRLDGRKSLIVIKPYDFSWQWKKLAGHFRPLSEKKGQTFSVSPAAECMINNDEEMVYQVLSNLVSNAIKYAPQNGSVDLNARVKGSTLIVTVSDSGPGFLDKERGEMFSKFKRLSAKPSGGERSTGLGLYIVKQIAEACNIKLTLLKDRNRLCGATWELEFEIVQPGI